MSTIIITNTHIWSDTGITDGPWEAGYTLGKIDLFLGRSQTWAVGGVVGPLAAVPILRWLLEAACKGSVPWSVPEEIRVEGTWEAFAFSSEGGAWHAMADRVSPFNVQLPYVTGSGHPAARAALLAGADPAKALAITARVDTGTSVRGGVLCAELPPKVAHELSSVPMHGPVDENVLVINRGRDR